MSRHLLVLVSTDPAASHQPAEAVRIAAGVAVWKKAGVSLCLLGKARTLLDDDPGSDARQTRDHLAMLAELEPILLLAPHPREITPTPPEMNHRLIDLDELARLAAESDCVLHF